MSNYNEKLKAKVNWFLSYNVGDNRSGKKGIIIIPAILLLLILAACGTTTAEPEESSQPAAVQAAQSWLAEQLNVPLEDITVLNAEQVEWTDSCFGLGGPAEICAAVITPGWQANFEVDGQQYEVRFDETGTLFRSPQIF